MNGFEVYQVKEDVQEWRCSGCGRLLSYFGKGCEYCEYDSKIFFGTWCPVDCLMVMDEVEV